MRPHLVAPIVSDPLQEDGSAFLRGDGVDSRELLLNLPAATLRAFHLAWTEARDWPGQRKFFPAGETTKFIKGHGSYSRVSKPS